MMNDNTKIFAIPDNITGGSMGNRSGMGYRKEKDYEYEKYDREYPDYERMEHRGDYGRRFM